MSAGSPTPVRVAARAPGAGPAGTRRLAAALLVAVSALAFAGAVLGAGVISRGDGAQAPPPLPHGPFGTAQDIPASFGVVAVEHVEKVKGITAKSVSGQTHGISGFVPAGKVQIQASVTLTNLTGEPVAYSPRQFRLLVGKERKPVATVRSSLRPGTLQPDASIDGQLKFVAPRNDSKLWMQFRDPEGGRLILIDLGRTGKTTPQAAFDRFRDGHTHP
jgi:hypothetical protein